MIVGMDPSTTYNALCNVPSALSESERTSGDWGPSDQTTIVTDTKTSTGTGTESATGTGAGTGSQSGASTSTRVQLLCPHAGLWAVKLEQPLRLVSLKEVRSGQPQVHPQGAHMPDAHWQPPAHRGEL